MATTGFVILKLLFRRERKVWTGECVELGTATYGRTIERAHDELVELVELHLNTLEKTGERERFFEEHGIRFYTDTMPPEIPGTLPVAEGESEPYLQAHRFPIRELAAV